ncbi:hypothetical protein IVB14_04595 [Bradyrhizobium sp. 180]|uniref:hypothetical protein n=1 Tax=unclassified Bradyrhizobium TaxID=2631580 RepID=UPI001FFB24F6|nr:MULTISPECIES: hypothetical protein [unclassified Bradyrhizobium]MCK1422226.1 hypothetical protein [Bradyrhizobium sp. CW12]MCK1489717.1 hypothetical protein [Bradyrhizobium sp. 180]MCK1528959.1 hypothetical protein [Bradyrhizobium sp. 182]MCK1644077.1 hypothetical protein [Bradyrhizobium sp. 154]
MNAPLPVVLAVALLSAAIATMPADAAPRKKKLAAVSPAATLAQPPTDRFLACDVRVRDYLREGGAVTRVTKIEVDDARLQLNIHHEYGEAGKSSRKYLRGDTEEEMRKNLRGILDEFAAAAKAATAGRAWYVVAARKVMPDPRDGSGETTSPWTAVVLADFDGKCRPITFYQSVDRTKLDPELNKKLDE